MPISINPNRPLDLGAFARLYTGSGMSPEQVESDLFLNAPTAGKSYLSEQWSHTAPGSKGQSPVQFFNALTAAKAAQNAPPVLTADDKLIAMDRARGTTMSGPRLTNVGVTPGQFAEQQRQRGGTALEQIMASYMDKDEQGKYTDAATRRMSGVPDAMKGAPTLRPISHEELLAHPTFQRMVQEEPEKASRLFRAAHGVDLGGYLNAQYKQEEIQQQAATSTLKGLMDRGELSFKDGIPHITRKDAMGMPETKPADTLTAQMIFRALTPTKKGTTRLGLVPPHMTAAANVIKGYVMQGMGVEEAIARAHAEASPAATASAAAGVIPDVPDNRTAYQRGNQAVGNIISGVTAPAPGGVLDTLGHGASYAKDQAANWYLNAPVNGLINTANFASGMLNLPESLQIPKLQYNRFNKGPDSSSSAEVSPMQSILELMRLKRMRQLQLQGDSSLAGM